MKRIIWKKKAKALIALALAIALSGCAGEKNAPTTQTTTETEASSVVETQEEAPEEQEAEEIAIPDVSGVNETDPTISHIRFETATNVAFVEAGADVGLSDALRMNDAQADDEDAYDDDASNDAPTDGGDEQAAEDNDGQETDDDVQPLQLRRYYDALTIADDEYPALDAHLRARNETAGEEGGAPEIRVYRADSRVFSYVEQFRTKTQEDDAAIATDYDNVFVSHNLDPQTAKEIPLEAVVNDLEALSALAADAVVDKYVARSPIPDAGDYFDGVDLQAEIRSMLESDERPARFAWAPAYYGLRLTFQAGALAGDRVSTGGFPIAIEYEDDIEITVPYTDAPAIFSAEYTSLPENYIAQLARGVTYYLPLDEDGAVSSLTIDETLRADAHEAYDTNDGYYSVVSEQTYTMTVDGAAEQFSDPYANADYNYYGTNVYLVKKDGAFYLYLDRKDGMELDRLQIYAYADGAFAFVGTNDEMIDDRKNPPLNPDDLLTERWYAIIINPMAQYKGAHGYRRGAVGERGAIVSDEKFYTISDPYGYETYTTRVDLHMSVLGDDEAAIGEEILFPAGETLTMFRYMLDVSADFYTRDGQIVRMYVNGVDGIDNVDGVEISEALFGDGSDPAIQNN